MTRQLDIGVFGIRGIPSTYSGFETFLTALLPELVERGHSVTVYCRRDATEDDWNGSYRSVRRRSLPSISTKQLDTLSHGAVAATVARFSHHDVVLVCNVANAPFCLIARAMGQHIVMNVDGQEWVRGKWGAMAKRLFYLFARISKYSSSALIADCNAMNEIYADLFAAPSSVIPYCWTQIRNDHPAPSDGGPGDRYFVAGGRLIPENNIERIAEAFSRTDLAFSLRVLGTANYRSPVQVALDDLAARDDRIQLHGHVSDRARYAEILHGSVCYFHGHSVGGMNPSLVEAMGSGALIAALGTPFNREVLGSEGLFFNDCGEDLLRVFQQTAAMDDAERTRRRAANVARADEEFSLSAVADAYEELLTKTAQSSAFSRVTIMTRWAGRE